MNLPFTSYDPNAPASGGFKNPRLVSCKADSKDPFDIFAGDNQFYLLPSCSNWEQLRAAGWQGYLPGAFYQSVRVKTYADRFAQELKVAGSNPLTDAYWKLFNALCPAKKVEGTELDKIKKAGFDAGVDHRCLLNIVRNTTQGLSPLRWFNVGAERPNTDVKNLKRKRLLTQILDAISQIYANTQNQVLGFELDRAVLLKVGVQFNGSIAQFSYAMPEFGAQGYIISNLMGAIPEFSPEQLDEARAWASTPDVLPELDQIPALIENPIACDVLGLSTNRVAATPGHFAQPQMSAGMAAAAGQFQPQQFQPQQPAGAPPMAPQQFQPQQPAGAPPMAPQQFQPQRPAGAPPAAPQQFQPQQPVGAPPVAPPMAPQQFQPQQPVGAPPVAPPVAPPAAQGFSTMTAESTQAAASNFAAQLEMQRQQAQGGPAAPGAF